MKEMRWVPRHSELILVTVNFHEKLTPHPVYTVEKSDIMKMSACVPTGATPMIPGGILL